MKLIFCVKCQKKHTSDWGWTHKKWDTPVGVVDGWGCNKHPTKGHEWTTDAIREGRRKYRKELLQSHRGGELSKEYVEAYPEKAKGMVKSGVVTQKQVKKAKNVWGNDNV